MMNFKDWVLSPLISKSLASSRPLSSCDGFFEEDERLNEEHSSQAAQISGSSNANQESQYQNEHVFPSQEVAVGSSCQSNYSTDEKKLDALAKIENLQITLLRLLRRLGFTHDNVVVAKVLYRIHLATLIRAGESSDLKRTNLRSDKARAIAAEQEAAGLSEVDFMFRVLVLGKTGVGKSSTINSIFDQPKTTTDAFQPATECVREILGTVNGINISFIDTPGLLPPCTSTVRKNRKILFSIKRFIRRSPPDLVLYFERLDLIRLDYIDFPLLKLVTDIFGSALWFNTILVMTHSSSILADQPNGYPFSYESYVAQCKDVVQHYIHQAISDSKLENPVLLVENHPHCNTNIAGEKILPNGQVWKSQFLLLCICTKVLADVNIILKFHDSFELGLLGSNRLPSLPHLLSSFIRHHVRLSPNGGSNEIDEISFPEMEEDDEYDELPPIRILKKSQFEKLSKSQKRDYLDELEYRETLYLKKQLMQESHKRRENRLNQSDSPVSDDNSEKEAAQPEAVLLPDMDIPPSFDSDCPIHRYRCFVTGDQWFARPVLDPHGWDRDVGFDGINLETAREIRQNIFASVSGQMSKDKLDFSIQSESAATFLNPKGSSCSIGFDVQSSGKELIHTLHSETMLKSWKHNITEVGLSLMSFADKFYVGTKIGDSISVGNRLKFVMNASRMEGAGQVAHGGSFETVIRGKDYPVRNDGISLTMTVLSFKKETVVGGNLQSDFRLCWGTRVSVNANLNSQRMGQICVKTSSSDHMEIALIALVSIFRSLLRMKTTDNRSREALETG